MTLVQLEYVLAIDSKRTISAAAESLNVSHPAISRALSNLEDELGIKIFTRSRNGMKITENGRPVLESAQKIMEEAGHLHEYFNQQLTHQIIPVAVFPIDGLHFLADVINTFRQNCDHARISLQHMELSEAVTKVREQQTTFAICTFTKKAMAVIEKEFTVVPLLESNYAVGCSPNLLHINRGFITPEEVRHYPLILHDDPMITDALTDIFGDLTSLNVLLYSNDNAMIKKMVAEGHALSIHSMFLAKGEPRISSGEIQLIPLKNDAQNGQDDAMNIDFVLFYNKKKRLNQAERLFVQALKKSIEKWR